ncbi:hypothetical protein, partial [Salinicola aestuarinus]|uniref:hypothetical protein n=1 Tax=Salinicola aestuarinus TaxID=1949082 RepID=UPI001CB75BBC
IDVIQRWRRMDNAGAVAAFEQADHQGEEPYYASINIMLPKIENVALYMEVEQKKGGDTNRLATFATGKSDNDHRQSSSGVIDGGGEEGGLDVIEVETGSKCSVSLDLEGFAQAVSVRLNVTVAGRAIGRDNILIEI